MVQILRRMSAGFGMRMQLAMAMGTAISVGHGDHASPSDGRVGGRRDQVLS